VDFATGLKSDRPVSVQTSYCHCAPSGSLSVRCRSMGAIKRALVRDDAIFPQISEARPQESDSVAAQSDSSRKRAARRFYSVRSASNGFRPVARLAGT
jgi:hypothetical protein